MSIDHRNKESGQEPTLPLQNVTTSAARAWFRNVVAEAGTCMRCPAMCERTAVLSDSNGPLSARIMFIGEAPGRKGSDQTRVPFSGDKSGKNFDRFLASIGLTRDHIFITSAALCNPRSDSGANRKPTKSELANCAGFLRQTIAIINPAVVVTLGSVALEALRSIEPHNLRLKESAAKVQRWNGRVLVPIYHPSPQVLASHRRENEQLSDYKVLARAIEQASLELNAAALPPDVRKGFAFPIVSLKVLRAAPPMRRSLPT